VAIAAAARAGPPPTLSHAIALYESFEDVKATRVFRAILEGQPSRAVAAQAHLYLGLIAVNQLDVERAIREFKLGLTDDPTLDVGRGTSPKARLTFQEARRELERQLSQTPNASGAALASPPMVLAPTSPSQESGSEARPSASENRTVEVESAAPAAVAPAPESEEQDLKLHTAEAPRWHSPALALLFGGVGLASGVLAIYGGVEVVNYNSLVSSANGKPGSVSYPQTLGPQSAAQGWAPWVIPLAVLGVLGVTGGIFTW
jgi:hypothetical protein